MKEICIQVIHQQSGHRLSDCSRERANELVRLKRATWLNETTILLSKSQRKLNRKREEIIQKESRICYICDRFIPTCEMPTVDHVLPKALGGTDEEWNLRCCCHRCNNAKGGESLEFFIDRIKHNRSKFQYIDSKQLQRLENYNHQFYYLVSFLHHNVHES